MPVPDTRPSSVSQRHWEGPPSLEKWLISEMFEEATYEALELALEPGDRHILYTDGIVEAANPAKRVRTAPTAHAFHGVNESLAADPFADALLAEITNWTGPVRGSGRKTTSPCSSSTSTPVRIPNWRK